MENRSHLENKNGESRNMAQEHNTQQIGMLITASLFWRTKLLSPEKQPESVPVSVKGVADMRQERTHNALNGKSVQLVNKVRCITLCPMDKSLSHWIAQLVSLILITYDSDLSGG